MLIQNTQNSTIKDKDQSSQHFERQETFGIPNPNSSNLKNKLSSLSSPRKQMEKEGKDKGKE